MIAKDFTKRSYFEWPFIFAGETDVTFRAHYYKNGTISIELLLRNAKKPDLIPIRTYDDSVISYWFFGSKAEAVKSIHDSMHGIKTGVDATTVVTKILYEIVDWIFHLPDPEATPDDPPPTGLEKQILETVSKKSPFLSALEGEK